MENNLEPASQGIYRGTYAQMDELEELRSNYFNFAFQPKVINRYRAGQWYTEGAHFLIDRLTGDEIHGVPVEELRTVHLPMASFKRLSLRADRGEEAINSGASRDFGWQSQMVARIRQHGQILTFWQSHSVRAPGEVPSGVVSAQDDAFMNAIQPTIGRLRHYWGDSLPEDPKGAIPTFLLDVGTATQIVESYRSLLGATIEVLETLEAEISLLHQVHSNELTSIYNSRTWKTRLGILRVINFLRRRG